MRFPGWNTYPVSSFPMTSVAFVLPVLLALLMISITFYICNCLYFPVWAEGLKAFPKPLLQKQKLSCHFPHQQEGKGQSSNYQQGLVNLLFQRGTFSGQQRWLVWKISFYDHDYGSRSERAVKWFLFLFLTVYSVLFSQQVWSCEDPCEQTRHLIRMHK